MPVIEIDGKTTYQPRAKGWDAVKDGKRMQHGVAQVLTLHGFFPHRGIACEAPRTCSITMDFTYRDLGRDPYHAKEIIERKLREIFPQAQVATLGCAGDPILACLNW